MTFAHFLPCCAQLHWDVFAGGRLHFWWQAVWQFFVLQSPAASASGV
jgi:hypothetical protein